MGTPVLMLRFGDCREGATATDGTVSLQSADYANLGDSSARGGADRAV